MDPQSDSPRPLADMLGDVPPEHDLRGRVIVLVIYAVGMMAGAMPVLEGGGWGSLLTGLAVGVLFFAPFAFVAGALQRFASWSWAFVGGWLLLFFLLAAFLLSDRHASAAQRGSAAAAAMMLLGALHYLWLRRWDFWADAPLERLRPSRRHVTREWRAARLARIASASCHPRAVSPRPGALWMRQAGASER